LFFRSREASPFAAVSDVRRQLLSVTSGLSLPYLEVNQLSRKVWDQVVSTTQASLFSNGAQREEEEFESAEEKGERHFALISCPAFYSGLYTAAGGDLAESRLETNYQQLAVPRLPDRVTVTRAIFRFVQLDLLFLVLLLTVLCLEYRAGTCAGFIKLYVRKRWNLFN
jgi:hypothetical protein